MITMKHAKPLLFLSSLLLLASCGSGQGATTSSAGSTSISSIESSVEASSVSAEASSPTESSSQAASSVETPDFDLLKESYGDFHIVGASSDAVYTFDATSSTYTINVSENAKLEYTLSGFFQGKIVVANGNNLSSFKGITFTLNNACLTNADNQSAVIEYLPESKNIELKAKKDSHNLILATGSALAISSNNNIELVGSGVFDFASYGADMHTIKADGDISIYGSHTINILYSAHDAFHGKHLSFVSETSVAYSGTVNVEQASSQAFDFETNKGKGTISVEGGTFNISNCASVFKTDVSLTISSGVTINANNLSEEPVVKGENSSSLEYVNEGIFNVDGLPYTHEG